MWVLTDPAFDQKPDNRHEQRGQHIQRFAFLDFENGQPRAGDQDAAYDRNFRQQIGRQEGGQIIGAHVDGALPDKQHRRRQNNPDAIGRGQYHRGDQVEGGVHEQISVVAADGAFDRPQNRQRSDAEQ